MLPLDRPIDLVWEGLLPMVLHTLLTSHLPLASLSLDASRIHILLDPVYPCLVNRMIIEDCGSLWVLKIRSLTSASTSFHRVDTLSTAAIMAVLKFVRTLVTRQDLSHIPAAQAPEGLSPNFVNPPSLATAYRILIYIFMPLMSIIVIIRLGTRLRQMHKLVADDCMNIIMNPVLYRP